MITEAETKEIEKEALELYPDLPWAETIGLGIEDNSYTLRIGYIAGATRMAERKNLEIEWLKKETKQFERMHDNLLSINESLQTELERVKAYNEYCHGLLELAEKKYCQMEIAKDTELLGLNETIRIMAEAVESYYSEISTDYKMDAAIKSFNQTLNEPKR